MSSAVSFFPDDDIDGCDDDCDNLPLLMMIVKMVVF